MRTISAIQNIKSNHQDFTFVSQNKEISIIPHYQVWAMSEAFLLARLLLHFLWRFISHETRRVHVIRTHKQKNYASVCTNPVRKHGFVTSYVTLYALTTAQHSLARQVDFWDFRGGDRRQWLTFPLLCLIPFQQKLLNHDVTMLDGSWVDDGQPSLMDNGIVHGPNTPQYSPFNNPTLPKGTSSHLFSWNTAAPGMCQIWQAKVLFLLKVRRNEL